MTLDWFIGFVEGEGCFTFHSKQNNTTRGGQRVYYLRPQPQFLIAQNGRQVLDLCSAFLGERGIRSRVWPKQSGQGNYELRVLGYTNCDRVADLLGGRLLSDKKRAQFEAWTARIRAPRMRGPVSDDQLLGPVPVASRQKSVVSS